jgi:hypothetical protein
MSRTARTTLHLCRAGAAAATAAVLLTACGGGGQESASGSAETSTAGAETSGTTASPEASDFCAQAEGIDQRVDEALSGVEDDDPSVPDAFRQIAVELRDIEAPDAIRQDWTELSSGLDRMADAFADFDITDPGSLEVLEEAEGNLTTASDNVDRYLRDECGI